MRSSGGSSASRAWSRSASSRCTSVTCSSSVFGSAIISAYVASSRRIKFAIKTHGRKSDAIAGAIIAAGHEFIREGTAEALLIDFDPPYLPYKPIIDQLAADGAKIILYPHSGGSPDLSYDGLWEPDPRVTANLVMAPGHAELLRRLEYPAPVHVVGWTYGDLKPFRPRPDVRTVVFAPIHPVGNGFMMPEYREANTRVFEALIKGPWRLIVRHIGTLAHNGLRKVDGVEYVHGIGRPESADINRADAIVGGNGTFPTIAISHGVPTVLYSQVTASLGLIDEDPTPLKRPELYRDYIRYPFDADDGPLDEIVHAAARSDEPIAAWKRRFIGEPFNAFQFTQVVERIVREDALPPTLEPTRSFTTVAFADELLERPELLREYTDRYKPGDDATLIIWGTGLDADKTLALTEGAVAAAGLDENALPDILLLPLPGSTAADELLAERASARLSDWPAAGKLGAVPRF